jgi:hypothetical protein
MPGPSIAVRVIGDLSNFAKSMGDTAQHGESAASRIRSGFTGAISAFNQTGVLGPFEGALNGIDQAIGAVVEHGRNIGPALMGVGGALAGIGAGLSALGSKDQAAHQQLQASVEATGKSYDDYGDQVEQAIKHQEKYGATANQTQDALRVMTQAFNDPQKALDELGTASDLAAAKHEDLSTAAGQLAKAANGSARILKELGISQKDATGAAKSHDEILKEISQKLSGQASAAADTFGGKMKGLKATIEDNVSEFGQKYGPALTGAGAAMAGLGATMQVTHGIVDALKNSTMLQSAATKTAEVAQWAWNAAMDANPIMIVVLAVAALIAAVVLAYQHVSWFRAIVDDFASAAVAAFNWIRDTVGAVIGWIADHWQLLLAIILGPIGLAADLVINNFDRIKWAVQSAIDFARSVFDGFVGFVSGLPGRVADFFSGMFDGLKNAAKAAFNFVADAWNNTAGRLNFSIPDWVPGVGGKSFGVPSIPHWYAQGGIFTSPSIIGVGEAGPEAVIPLNKGRLGPVVHIEHASFAQELDVDLFMKRVAWHTQTSRI